MDYKKSIVNGELWVTEEQSFFLLRHYGCLAFVLIREWGEVSGEELGVRVKS